MTDLWPTSRRSTSLSQITNSNSPRYTPTTVVVAVVVTKTRQQQPPVASHSVEIPQIQLFLARARRCKILFFFIITRPAGSSTQQKLELSPPSLRNDHRPLLPNHRIQQHPTDPELQLPSWTWGQGLQRMTAFFHMGPLVVTHDVKAYLDPAQRLEQDYDLAQQDAIVAGSAVGIPSLAAADWE